MLIIFLCIFFLANKNLLSRYKLNKLAYKIGEHIYPKKPDTILNANQLDEKIQINQSKELAREYVNNVLDKIDPLKFQSIFFNPKTISMKKLILISWLFILLGFFFQYNQIANSVFRWASPNTSFQAPKPFALKSITGNVRILGGNNTDIKPKPVVYLFLSSLFHIPLIGLPDPSTFSLI